MSPKEALDVIKPTREEFDQVVRAALEWADHYVSDPPVKVIPPQLVVGFRKEPGAEMQMALMVVPEGWADQAEKVAVLEKFGRHYYEEQLFPAVIALLAESWVVIGEPGREKELRRWRPSEHPDRQEMLMLAAMDMANRYIVQAYRPIERDGLGHILPAAWDGPHDLDKGSEYPILRHFWRGYVAPVLTQLN